MSDPAGSSKRQGAPTSEDVTAPTDAREAAPESGGLACGQSIGRYVLLERVGAGGMGVVYAAYDPELDRKIALKLLKPRRDEGEEGESRLLREAQAIARLSHPNVVAVYDVGSFRGRVFMAMELVEGHSLKRWLRRHGGRWRDTVRVLVGAGRGLAAAHSVGLVHRDFKPDNVLVGDHGRARVLDFGLARVAGEPSGDHPVPSPSSGALLGSSITATGTVMGTPAYMAPEQHAGLSTDARADQFSFCVVAYEALYGQRPFAGNDSEAVADAIIEGRIEPPPPGNTVPRWIRRIVVRGLSGRPEDRYRGMPALLAELARDPGARRRRAAAAFVGLAAIAGIAIGLTELRQRQAQVCAGASDKLAEIWDEGVRSEIGQAFSETGRPYATRASESVARIVDDWAESWTAVHTSACESTRVRHEQSEDMLDLQMACLDQQRSELRALLEQLRTADAQLVERSLSAVAKLPSPQWCTKLTVLRATFPPPSELMAAEAAEIRQRVSRSRALAVAGKYDEAHELARTALTEARKLGYDPVLAEALVQIGYARSQGGDFPGAEAPYDEAVRIAERARHDRIKAAALYHLAWLVGYKQARYAEAVRLARLAQAALVRFGDDDVLQSAISQTLGAMYGEAGDVKAAVRHHERAVELLATSRGELDRSFAIALENLAISQKQDGRLEDALAAHGKVLRIRRDVLGERHPSVANSLSNLSSTHLELGAWQQALAEAREAVELLEHSVGPEHAFLIAPLANVGSALIRIGEREQALTSLERALSIASNAVGGDHPDTAEVRGMVGEALLSLGRRAQARSALDQAYADLAGKVDTNSLKLAQVLHALGELRLGDGDAAAAQELLERAVLVHDSNVGALPVRHVAAILALASAVWERGTDRAHARELAQQARELDRRHGGRQRAQIDDWLAAHEAVRASSTGASSNGENH